MNLKFLVIWGSDKSITLAKITVTMFLKARAGVGRFVRSVAVRIAHAALGDVLHGDPFSSACAFSILSSLTSTVVRFGVSL